MSTSLRMSSIRASAIASILARHPRLPRHAVYALPELATLHRDTIDRALQHALDRGWVEVNVQDELIALVRAPGAGA